LKDGQKEEGKKKIHIVYYTQVGCGISKDGLKKKKKKH